MIVDKVAAGWFTSQCTVTFYILQRLKVSKTHKNNTQKSILHVHFFIVLNDFSFFNFDINLGVCVKTVYASGMISIDNGHWKCFKSFFFRRNYNGYGGYNNNDNGSLSAAFSSTLISFLPYKVQSSLEIDIKRSNFKSNKFWFICKSLLVWRAKCAVIVYCLMIWTKSWLVYKIWR